MKLNDKHFKPMTLPMLCRARPANLKSPAPMENAIFVTCQPRTLNHQFGVGRF